jgi:hypothetical protein
MYKPRTPGTRDRNVPTDRGAQFAAQNEQVLTQFQTVPSNFNVFRVRRLHLRWNLRDSCRGSVSLSESRVPL